MWWLSSMDRVATVDSMWVWSYLRSGRVELTGILFQLHWAVSIYLRINAWQNNPLITTGTVISTCITLCVIVVACSSVSWRYCCPHPSTRPLHHQWTLSVSDTIRRLKWRFRTNSACTWFLITTAYYKVWEEFLLGIRKSIAINLK